MASSLCVASMICRLAINCLDHPTHFSPKIGVATSKSSLTESQLKPSSSLGSGAEATRCFSCKSEISSHSMRCTASHVEIAVCAKCFATGKFPSELKIVTRECFSIARNSPLFAASDEIGACNFFSLRCSPPPPSPVL